MYPIAGPGATVDNKFTEGDPVTGLQATVVTANWANDVQAEILNVLVSAGLTPTPGVQNQLSDAIRKISGSPVGSVVNARMAVTTTTTSATFTADEVVVKSVLGGLSFILPSFSKTINIATVGLGGMDVGSAPVSGYVAIYAIFNPTTGVSGLLARNASAGFVGQNYAGANMPAGFTASALIGVWPTTGASQLRVGFQVGREISFIPILVLSSSLVQSSYAALSIAMAVPFNAVKVKLIAQIAGSSVGSTIGVRTASDIGGMSQSVLQSAAPSGLNAFAGVMTDTPMLTAQTIYYTADGAAGTITASFYVTGYSF